MKNFWLDRHRKRENAKKVDVINQAISRVLFKKFGIVIGKSPLWPKKNATKTQP